MYCTANIVNKISGRWECPEALVPRIKDTHKRFDILAFPKSELKV